MSWFTGCPVSENAIWPKLPTTMTCPLCGRQCGTKGYRRHLNCCCGKHGLTIEDYLRDHGDVLFQPFHALVAKTYSLMEFQQDAFGWQWAMLPEKPFLSNPTDWHGLPQGVHWGYREIRPFTHKPSYFMTLKATGRRVRRPETCALGPGPRFQYPHFRIHYRGQGTLAVRLKKDNRLLCFDVDSTDVEQVQRAGGAIRELKLDPHVEFSGKKGYHIWVFFDQDISESRLRGLADTIIRVAKLDYDLVYPLNNKLLKLPLGIHQATGNLAGFVDPDTLELLSGKRQTDYYLGILQQPFPADVVDALPDIHPSSTAAMPRIKNTGYSPSCSLSERVIDSNGAGVRGPELDWDQLDALLIEGRKLSQGRHSTLFILSLYLKDHLHCDRDETIRRLNDWSIRVQSSRSIIARLNDVDETVNKVFNKNLVCREMEIKIKTKILKEEEKKHIERVLDEYITVIGAFGSGRRKEDRSKAQKSILKIAYFMASIAKANQGVARLSNRFIAEKCGLSKRTVDRWIGLLVEDPQWTEAFDDNPAATLRRKPGLKGCLFDRIRRGRFGDSGPSVYVLKSEVATSLGWKVVYPAEYLPAAVQTDSFG